MLRDTALLSTKHRQQNDEQSKLAPALHRLNGIVLAECLYLGSRISHLTFSTVRDLKEPPREGKEAKRSI